MAKSRALAFAPRPSVVVVNSGPKRRGGIRRRARAVGRLARRKGGKAIRASLPITTIVLGGVGVGYAQAKGLLDKLPTIMDSKMVTLGLLGLAAVKYSRNPTIRMAGVAAMSAAAVDFGRVQGGGTSGFDDDGSY